MHTSQVPVAIAPRGYPSSAAPGQRLTTAYRGEADATGLIATSAELAKRGKVPLRIASVTVRPLTMFGGAIEPSAEELVVHQWAAQDHGCGGRAARCVPASKILRHAPVPVMIVPR